MGTRTAEVRALELEPTQRLPQCPNHRPLQPPPHSFCPLHSRWLASAFMRGATYDSWCSSSNNNQMFSACAKTNFSLRKLVLWPIQVVLLEEKSLGQGSSWRPIVLCPPSSSAVARYLPPPTPPGPQASAAARTDPNIHLSNPSTFYFLPNFTSHTFVLVAAAFLIPIPSEI